MADAVLPGRAADSPGPDPQYVAPGRQRVREPGVLAAGHRPGGEVAPGAGVVSEHLNYQQLAPSGGAVLHQMADRPGPMADAVTVHNSRAQVSQMDQARASAAGFINQLGAAAPSPVPGQPAPHTAAVDGGAPFRSFAERDPGVYSIMPQFRR